LNVEEVFSTYLYQGDDANAQVISNGIDLYNEGGLVWTKSRDAIGSALISSEDYTKKLQSDSTAAYQGTGTLVPDVGGNGYTVPYQDDATNYFNYLYASWTFRKAPKFFDVVTYTGTGSAQNISHNLGTTVGTLIVKRTDSTGDWLVQHRSLGGTYYMDLQNTNAAATNTTYWNNTTATSTEFTVGTSSYTNASGGTYVAYLFAHNDGDGEFGDGTQDIIKCGSYTGNGSSQDIDLGFEPQWIMIKNATSAQNWWIVDNMRGIVSGGNDPALLANDSGAEITGNGVADLNPNGFKVYESLYNTSANNYIYIAIRRGPMAVPESGTEVFDITTRDATHPSFDASFDVVDAAINRNTSGAFDWFAYARLLGTKYLQPNLTVAENTGASIEWDYMDGWSNGSGTNADLYSWMWKRAPNFFDVVTYTGDGTAGRTVSHNLGVAPEMMWVKNRDQTQTWAVYHKDLDATSPEDYYLQLQTSNARINTSAVFGAQPTDSVFTVDVASSVNQSGQGIIAYLFASLDGVSKVGSYTGNGTTQNIDCGFTSGARFVLIKRTDSTGDWEVYDTERGINAGNDSHLQLNTTTAQFLSADTIDPYNAGFTVNVDGSDSRSNASGASYIFYAIA
jgi:hypothetical protein